MFSDFNFRISLHLECNQYVSKIIKVEAVEEEKLLCNFPGCNHTKKYVTICNGATNPREINMKEPMCILSQTEFMTFLPTGKKLVRIYELSSVL